MWNPSGHYQKDCWQYNDLPESSAADRFPLQALGSSLFSWLDEFLSGPRLWRLYRPYLPLLEAILGKSDTESGHPAVPIGQRSMKRPVCGAKPGGNHLPKYINYYVNRYIPMSICIIGHLQTLVKPKSSILANFNVN